MKRVPLVLAVSALIAFSPIALARSAEKPSAEAEKPAPPAAGAMMTCPMMGAMPNTAMAEMMKGMADRMAGMFALSSEETVKLLTDKKAALGLSDAQAKAIADLMASSQQQKVRESMQGMRQMCPCMQAAR